METTADLSKKYDDLVRELAEITKRMEWVEARVELLFVEAAAWREDFLEGGR